MFSGKETQGWGQAEGERELGRCRLRLQGGSGYGLWKGGKRDRETSPTGQSIYPARTAS